MNACREEFALFFSSKNGTISCITVDRLTVHADRENIRIFSELSSVLLGIRNSLNLIDGFCSTANSLRHTTGLMLHAAQSFCRSQITLLKA